MTSILRPSTVGPKSSTAMRAASTEPCPDRSAFMPDRSVRTPMRMGVGLRVRAGQGECAGNKQGAK